MSLVYAIDFGTSNSLLAATDGERVLPPAPLEVEGAPDRTIVRSVLYSPRDGVWDFGMKAIDAYSEQLAEGRIFRSVKKYLPDPHFTGTVVHGRRFNLPELIAVFLKELRERANAFYDQDVTSVVLGRPAAFSLDAEQDKLAERRLEAAARLAGFRDISFCPEPIAAAYEFRHSLVEPKTVLIADFGGGTSDFTILRMSRDAFSESDVLALGGVSVAGDRFDGSIMRHMVCPHFGSNVVYKLPMGSNELRLPQHLINRMCSPPDISFLARADILQLLKDAQRWSMSGEDARRMERLFILVEEHLGYKLFREIERTKIGLSDATSARFAFQHPGIEIEEEVFAADFKAVSQDNVERITESLDKTVAAAGLRHDQIEIVCCTGGTAKLPALSQALAKRFGAEKLQQHRHFHSVVHGLAEKARTLVG